VFEIKYDDGIIIYTLCWWITVDKNLYIILSYPAGKILFFLFYARHLGAAKYGNMGEISPYHPG